MSPSPLMATTATGRGSTTISTVGPDEMYEIQKAEVLDKSDLDVAIMTAWTGTDRDNKLYGFVRATDDTLVVTSDVFDDGWRDDDLEIITDANASGGPHDGDGEAGTRAEGQQFTMHLPVPGIYETPYGGDGSWWLRWQVVEEIHWMDEFAESRVTTNPPGSDHGFDQRHGQLRVQQFPSGITRRWTVQITASATKTRLGRSFA